MKCECGSKVFRPNLGYETMKCASCGKTHPITKRVIVPYVERDVIPFKEDEKDA